MADAEASVTSRAAWWSGAGGMFAGAGALASWFCCVPVVAGALGGLAGAASFAWKARPWLLGAAALLLAVGFRQSYRRVCTPGGACLAPARRRRARIILWISTVVFLLALTFPLWSSWLYYAFL